MGDVLVKPFVDLQLLDVRKHVLFKLNRQLDTFVPHTTLIYPVPLDNLVLNPGNYQVVIDFGPTGAEQHFVRTLTVSPAQANVPPPSQRGRAPAGPSPLLWLVALVPLLALAFVVVLLSRRRRHCAHCGRPWTARAMSVAAIDEVRSCVRCKDSLARFGTRVRLCPECFAGHRGWDRSVTRVKVHVAQR
jgi:hypothetical protein